MSKRKPEQLELEVGRAGRPHWWAVGSEWVARHSIGLTVALPLAAIATIVISLVSSRFDFPYESPFGLLPDGVWRWCVTWLVGGGAVAAVIVSAHRRVVRWLGGHGRSEPRLQGWKLLGIGGVCIVLIVTLVTDSLLDSSDSGETTVNRRVVDPNLVCDQDARLRSPVVTEWADGTIASAYDSNGNGDVDVFVFAGPGQAEDDVYVDLAENGSETPGHCRGASFEPSAG